MLFHAPDNAALAQHVGRLRRHWQERIASRLQRAIDAGELPTSPSADDWARYLVSLMQGMGIQARDGASREALAVAARLGFTTMFGSGGTEAPERRQAQTNGRRAGSLD